MNKLSKISNSIPAFFSALFNKNTPFSAKLAVIAAIVYAVAPADFVTDLIPFLGWFDDALVMTVLFAIANKLIPEQARPAKGGPSMEWSQSDSSRTESEKVNQARESREDYIDDVDYEVMED